MNGILFINKPQQCTSFDVCARLRHLLKEKSIGHTGTLDPMATGLMIVLVGKSTKLLPYCQHDEKEYQAQCVLGAKTSTGDIWGEKVEEKPLQPVTENQWLETCASFIGESTQIPPMVSAIKKDGQPLYKLARQGLEVEREPRTIEIKEMEVLATTPSSCTFRAMVSKGTYIRTLCEDLAEKTGNVGTMASLERTAIGAISLAQAQTLEEVENNPQWQDPSLILDAQIPQVAITDKQAVMQGKKMRLNQQEALVFLTFESELLAVYEKTEEPYVYRCKRGLWV